MSHAVVRAPAPSYDDMEDATRVDVVVSERARQSMHDGGDAFEDVTTVARRAAVVVPDFDDVTKVWSPARASAQPASSGSVAAASGAMGARGVFTLSGDDVTRVGPRPVAAPAPVARAQEPTVSTRVPRRRSPVRVAIVATLAVLALGLGSKWHQLRPGAPRLSAPAAHPAAAAKATPAPLPSPVPAAPRTLDAPSAAALPPSPVPAPGPGALAPLADERAAVDAVASGDVARAARLYAALAAAHPDNEAFREAARILRATKEPHR